MLTLLTLAALFGLYRLAHAAIATLRRVPHSNDDLVFF